MQLPSVQPDTTLLKDIPTCRNISWQDALKETWYAFLGKLGMIYYVRPHNGMTCVIVSGLHKATLLPSSMTKTPKDQIYPSYSQQR